MCQKFYWTAKLFKQDQTTETRYFKTQAERDLFVCQHHEWKKRGKICTKNIKKHLLEDENSKFIY